MRPNSPQNTNFSNLSRPRTTSLSGEVYKHRCLWVINLSNLSLHHIFGIYFLLSLCLAKCVPEEGPSGSKCCIKYDEVEDFSDCSFYAQNTKITVCAYVQTKHITLVCTWSIKQSPRPSLPRTHVYIRIPDMESSSSSLSSPWFSSSSSSAAAVCTISEKKCFVANRSNTPQS